MIWVDCTAAKVNENDVITDPLYVRDKALHRRDGPLEPSLLVQRQTDLLKQGYTIIKGLPEPFQAPRRLRHALNRRVSFESTTLRDLEQLILSMVPWERCVERGVGAPFAEFHFQYSSKGYG